MRPTRITYLLLLSLFMWGLVVFAPQSHAACTALANDGSFDCASFKDTCPGDCPTDEYKSSIAGTESGGCYNCVNSLGYAGRYQFGDSTRQGLANKYSCLPKNVSRAAFVNCPCLQEAFFKMFNQDNWKTLQNCGAASKVGQTVNGVQITQGCLLAMSHLGGAGGACKFVNSGKNPCDAYGTCLSDYCKKHGGVTNAFGPCTDCSLPPGDSGAKNCVAPGPTPPPLPGGPSTPTPPSPPPDNPQGCGPAGCDCVCSNQQSAETDAHIRAQHNITRTFITEQFRFHQNWLFGAGPFYQDGKRDSFWELHVQWALMAMTEQLVTTGMAQMFVLGTFFDAREQLQTQMLLQKLEAQAHKDYQPSFDMCVIGTNVRSMAAADRNGEFTSFIMNQRGQDREIGLMPSAAAYSSLNDRSNRTRHMQERYCDQNDNDGKLKELCKTAVNASTINRDVNYTRTIDDPRSLNIDFTDGTPTADEQDVLALTSNLFASDVLDKPGPTVLSTEKGEGVYMDMRALIAKRSVLRNSIDAIVGMKTAGSETSEETLKFTQKLLEQMGITDEDDRLRLLAGTQDDRKQPAKRPSYYAQLEAMAQKIYEEPQFYTNLYDTPVNVERKDVAMQAINLMLNRDMFKSELRTEMVYSVLLELELMKYQNDVQNRMNSLTERYQEN